MRVISGIFKGRSLPIVPSKQTRPTKARVRKSMLQILEPFNSASVLDLFSGSGILGIEALSRGADSLVSIESDKKVFKALSRNLLDICRGCDYQAIQLDVFKYIQNTDNKFDFILCDPPYSKYDYMDLFIKSKRLLKHSGLFCMEMRKEKIDESLFRVKVYGNTQIIIWENNE